MATTTITAPSSLPTPAERPNADVVIYDGDCSFCTGSAKKLAKWDTGGRLSFLSLHDPEVARRYPDLSHDALMREMYLIDGQGRRHAGAAAFRVVTRRLPRLWILAPILHIPFTLPVWQWFYRRFAAMRYRFGRTSNSCDSGACSIHFGKKK